MDTYHLFFLAYAVVNAERREDWIGLMGIVASLSCVAALTAAWILLPRWRSLQTYVCLNEVIYGTTALCIHPDILKELFQEPSSSYVRYNISYFLCLVISFCWSVCSSIVAFLKLVKLQPKISYEKTIATVFSFGLFVIIMILSVGLTQLIFCLSDQCQMEYDMTDNMYMSLSILVLMLLGVICINIVLYIIICIRVMSCCCVSMSNRSWSHVISLIGVGVTCQVTAAIEHIIKIQFKYQSYFSDSDDIQDTICLILRIMFHLRLVPLTIVLLCNKTSRVQWKAYMERRRNVIRQAMPLRRRRQEVV